MVMIIVEPIKNFKYWLANLQSPGCEINVEKISFDDKSLKRHARHHLCHMYSYKNLHFTFWNWTQNIGQDRTSFCLKTKSYVATCLKSPYDGKGTGSLFQLVLRNLRNPIHSLYTWPTVVSDIGKPLKLPATTILAPTKKKSCSQAFVIRCASNF